MAHPEKKVTLFNFDGSPRVTYSVSTENVASDARKINKKLGHQIIVVDRSGSMYHDIDALKDTVIKVLTLNEFEDSDMLVSLISYSSQGDVTLHFERTPVSEVMMAGSDHLKEIKRIGATFLTCASQAMVVAEGLINDDEITGIMLHSDGYANDPSPRYESEELDEICKRLQKRDVFVNTIAYSNYSDFVLLSRVASSVSGTCTKATSTKEVYRALSESCLLLSEGQSSVAEVSNEFADYTVFMSKDPQKIIGNTESFTVKGIGDSNYIVFRFKEVTLDPTAIATETIERTALYGMARAKLSTGHINDAKMAMMSSMNKSLTEANIRALTPNQLSEMAAGLEDMIFSPSSEPIEYFAVPGEGGEGSSILDLVEVLDKNRNEILLNVNKVTSGYRRRGLKKTAGKREKDGTVTIPIVDTKIADAGDFIKMGSFDINRDSATINMQVDQRTNLIDRVSGKVIPEVAGVLLDNLMDYKKYTVVGDGELNLQSLFVRFSTKNAFKAVQALGLLEGEAYSHSTEYELALSEMPVCSLSSEATISPDTFDTLSKLNIMGRILTGLSKGSSSTYSPEQVEELKKHCLSDALYINIPMMNKHDSLDDALKDGIVDSRTSYKITIGDTKVINTGVFKSANAFLDRMYVVTSEGDVDFKKPNINEVFFNPKVDFKHKVLSARTKVTMADNIQKAIYDEVLGLSDPDFLMEIGALIGVPELTDLRRRKSLSAEEILKIVESAKRSVVAMERHLWATKVSPIVFQIGSTGILPEGMNSVAMSAEELVSKYPNLTLTKAEKEGTFFDIGGVILSVYASKAYFTTDRARQEAATNATAATVTA